MLILCRVLTWHTGWLCSKLVYCSLTKHANLHASMHSLPPIHYLTSYTPLSLPVIKYSSRKRFVVFHTDQAISYLATWAEFCPTRLHIPIPRPIPQDFSKTSPGCIICWWPTALILDVFGYLMHVDSVIINSLPSTFGLPNGKGDSFLSPILHDAWGKRNTGCMN